MKRVTVSDSGNRIRPDHLPITIHAEEKEDVLFSVRSLEIQVELCHTTRLWWCVMVSNRTRFNPKRRFIATRPSEEVLNHLAERACYGGHAVHKRIPGDYGLTPPSSPRPDKTLCDTTGIFLRQVAVELLRQGIRRGLISDWSGDGFPRNIWSVSRDGIPLEAKLDDGNRGSYHGYPLESNDPFGQVVIKKWNTP